MGARRGARTGARAHAGRISGCAHCRNRAPLIAGCGVGKAPFEFGRRWQAPAAALGYGGFWMAVGVVDFHMHVHMHP